MTRNFILNPENQFTFTNIFSFLMIDLQKGAKFFLKGKLIIFTNSQTVRN